MTQVQVGFELHQLVFKTFQTMWSPWGPSNVDDISAEERSCRPACPNERSTNSPHPGPHALSNSMNLEFAAQDDVSPPSGSRRTVKFVTRQTWKKTTEPTSQISFASAARLGAAGLRAKARSKPHGPATNETNPFLEQEHTGRCPHTY